MLRSRFLVLGSPILMLLSTSLVLITPCKCFADRIAYQPELVFSCRRAAEGAPTAQAAFADPALIVAQLHLGLQRPTGSNRRPRFFGSSDRLFRLAGRRRASLKPFFDTYQGWGYSILDTTSAGSGQRLLALSERSRSQRRTISKFIGLTDPQHRSTFQFQPRLLRPQVAAVTLVQNESGSHRSEEMLCRLSLLARQVQLDRHGRIVKVLGLRLLP